MSFARVYSAQTVFLQGQIISIEVDLSQGLHSFSIVGLPDKALEESKDRIASAIKNSGFTSPKSKNQKVVISLAPANIRKDGTALDVAMALAYLLSSEEINFEPEGKVFFGELALDGSIREVSGTLALVCEAKRAGFKEVFVPKSNAVEAGLIEGILVYPLTTLAELIEHLDTKKKKSPQKSFTIVPQPITKTEYRQPEFSVDFKDIKGQETAKRGLEIAAGGGHNVALYGPPGTGKTMLAKAFQSILPALSFDELLETTMIHSIAGTLREPYIALPPFRSPHHSASPSAIIGGGSQPKPGEITLAHHGILFLDEFPEFDRRVLECLREPLEERSITINRSKGSTRFPAQFILIAALNPCPCGNHGAPGKTCVCSRLTLQQYQRKISGPIIDRIDLWLEVGSIDYKKLNDLSGVEESSIIAERIIRARQLQKERYHKKNITINHNAEIQARHISKHITFNKEAEKTLTEAAEKLGLSPRAYHRVIKVSRTIADLAQHEEIEQIDVLEALQYRPKKQYIG